MKPAGEHYALRGRRALSYPDLWTTAVLHAVLIGVLILWNLWAVKEWPSRSDGSLFYLAQPILVFNAHWVLVFGAIVWLADVAGYGLIRVRRGLRKALVFGVTMTAVWSLLLLASLAWTAVTIEEEPLVVHREQFPQVQY